MSLTVRIESSLDAWSSAAWNDVASIGSTSTVFQQYEWIRCWWATYGRGELIIASVWREQRPVLIVPLFVDGGMAFLVGSGGSDYQDLIGDGSDPTMVAQLLGAVLETTPTLLGFRFYHVPDVSPTGHSLREAAEHIGWIAFDEGELPAPVLDLGAAGDAGRAAANRTSLVRHTKKMERSGRVDVSTTCDSTQIVAALPEFFAQHIGRWQDTGFPSLFEQTVHRRFYESLARASDHVHWLRFTTVRLDDKPVAFHFGFSFEGRYLWYKPSFDMAFARLSPGEVLLRHLLLDSVSERARVFDFGLGDEPFKHRFATHVAHVRTWGLYPRQ